MLNIYGQNSANQKAGKKKFVFYAYFTYVYVRTICQAGPEPNMSEQYVGAGTKYDRIICKGSCQIYCYV